MTCKLFFSAFFMLLIQGLTAQSNYNHREAFHPFFYPYPGNEFRSASGEPGPKYWQNRADYRIEATLHTDAHAVSGKVTMTYTNNSPDALRFIWLQMDQHIYRKDSRATATTTNLGGRWANTQYTNGYLIEKMFWIKNGIEIPVQDTLTADTRMQVMLEEPLTSGASLQLVLQYQFTVPEYGTDRMGRMKFDAGWAYEIAQWYPRVCVYDDISGWNTNPYLGAGEFYLEYGDVDFAITAPAGVMVVGSGALLNPAECYSKEEWSRWKKAEGSDQTILIRTADEIGQKKSRKSAQQITWKFRCENTRDVAWAASEAFIMDAARIHLPSGKKAMAVSVYPLESASEKSGNDWRRSTEYTKSSVEFYSKYLFEYPYPVATNVAGIVGGMEYPGIVFCSSDAAGKGLWGVTDHEFGHTWFPMIVGNNERKFAWMDEGFNTFINSLAAEDFNKGEYNETASVSGMSAWVFSEKMDGLFNTPDIIQQSNLGVAAYYKPAMMLKVLREEVLGRKRFDRALKEYVRRWAFRHPTPWDFFHTIENVAGEDLGWFWRSWVLNSWKFDVAVEEVSVEREQEGIVAKISLQLREKMPLPVTLRITDKANQITDIALPVEIWQRGGKWTVPVPLSADPKMVEVDPDGLLPDMDRSNNQWRK